MTSKQDNDSQIQADTLRAGFIEENGYSMKPFPNANREKFNFLIIKWYLPQRLKKTNKLTNRIYIEGTLRFKCGPVLMSST